MGCRLDVVEAECYFCALSDARVLVENTCIVKLYGTCELDGIAASLRIVRKHMTTTATRHFELFVVAK